jgi:hypothetical protein
MLVVFTVLVMIVRVLVMGGRRGMTTIMIGSNDTDNLSSLCGTRKRTVGLLSCDFDESGPSADERENAEHGVVVKFLGDI